MHMQNAKKAYDNLAFDAYTILREVDYTREEVEDMPLLELFEALNVYSPRIKQLMENRYGKEAESAITGAPNPEKQRQQRVNKQRGGR